MIEPNEKIGGISLPEKGFKLYESIGTVDVDIVYEILKGNIAAYRVSNYFSSETASQITENFWNSPYKVPRLGYGQDGVEGYFIGASHIEKTTSEYLKEANNFEEGVKQLYKGTVDPISEFRELLATGNKKITVRPASFNGLNASHSKAVAWNNFGNFLLEPHDDLAQLRDPHQEGFEIQKTTRVVAVNFYPQVLPNSGQLKIWNIEPDVQSRTSLGLTYSGFPYPSDLLEGFSSIVIPVKTGDVCIINGNLIHAVLRGEANSLKDRLLISFFMALNDSDEIIWWT